MTTILCSTKVFALFFTVCLEILLMIMRLWFSVVFNLRVEFSKRSSNMSIIKWLCNLVPFFHAGIVLIKSLSILATYGFWILDIRSFISFISAWVSKLCCLLLGTKFRTLVSSVIHLFNFTKVAMIYLGSAQFIDQTHISRSNCVSSKESTCVQHNYIYKLPNSYLNEHLSL